MEPAHGLEVVVEDLRAGGEDTVSLQVIAVEGEAEPSAREPRRGVSTFFLVLPLILAAVLAGALLPWRSWLAREPPVSTAPPATPDLTDLTDPTDRTDPTDPYAAPGTVPLESEFDEPSPPVPVVESTPQVPRLTVLSPGDGRAPEVKQRVLRTYPGNWSTPAALEDRLAGSLGEERIYFRPGFGPAADHLAEELGYASVPWPEELAREHAEADLLVVYGGTP